MTANTWAMACVWLALGQTPSDVLVTNQRSLSVPVNIPESRKADLRELVLYASNDLGRNWQQVAVMPPSQSAFTFTAAIDGNYWLRVAVISKAGKQEPENLFQGPPDQKVVIDTMKPLLRMKAPERAGDNVVVAWELQEDNPDWSSFRLEHQAKDGAAWTPIQATAGLTGEARLRPTTPGPITVRLTLKDQAGNQAIAVADVPGTVSTTAFTNPQAPQATPPAPVFPSVPAAQLPMTPVAPTVPAPVAQPVVEAPILPPPPSQPIKTVPSPSSAPPTVNAPWTASNTKDAELGRVVASSQSPAPMTTVPVQAVETRRPLPPLQYVNHPEVTLEYELARVGPSGIGSIDLWWTQNDGQTWELYAVDPESKNGTIKGGRHKRTVELPGDGVYGFILVVKSKAGLGKAPPRAGDIP